MLTHGTRMQSHLILGDVVDTLDNVDLAAVRPVGSNRPECRPCRAAGGHVLRVQDQQLTLLEWYFRALFDCMISVKVRKTLRRTVE